MGLLSVSATLKRKKFMSARTFDISKAKKNGNVRVVEEGSELFPKSLSNVSVILHETTVLQLNRVNNVVTLNTGGYNTPTTFRAINIALAQITGYEGFKIYKLKGITMFGSSPSNSWVFTDGMVFGGGFGLKVNLISK